MQSQSTNKATRVRSLRLRAARVRVARERVRVARRERLLRVLVIPTFGATMALLIQAALSLLGLRSEAFIALYLAPLGLALAFVEEWLFRRVAVRLYGFWSSLLFYIVYALLLSLLLPYGRDWFISATILAIPLTLSAQLGWSAALLARAWWTMLAFGALYSLSLALNYALFAAPFAFLLIKGYSMQAIEQQLRLVWQNYLKALSSGTKLFAAILILLFALGAALYSLGLLDTEKVAAVVRTEPAPALIAAAAIAPIGEELFFRGFVQPRIGLLATSIAFAAIHIGYGSIAELLGAFLVSLLIGWWFMREKNIQPCIIAHAFYNTFSIIVMLLMH